MEERKYKTIAKYLALLIILSFILFRFDFVKGYFAKGIEILTPFIVGGVFALFINVPAKAIYKYLLKSPMKKISSKVLWIISLVLSFILILTIISIVFGSVIPDVIDSLIFALEQFPNIVDNTIDWFRSFDLRALDIDEVNLIRLESFIENLSNQALTWLRNLSSSLISGGFSIVTNAVSFLVNGLLALIFCIYLLLSKDKLAKQSTRNLYAFLSAENARRGVLLGKRVNEVFYNFLSGVGMEAIIYTILSYITMRVLKLPYASSIAMINGLLTFVPYFGAIFGGLVGAVLIMTISFRKALIFIIMTLVLQQIESNIIYPRVVGNKVGLPSIWVMVSVSLFGALAGVPGMMLAVPVITFIYLTLGDIVEYRLNLKNGGQKNLSSYINESNIGMTGEEAQQMTLL